MKTMLETQKMLKVRLGKKRKFKGEWIEIKDYKIIYQDYDESIYELAFIVKDKTSDTDTFYRQMISIRKGE